MMKRSENNNLEVGAVQKSPAEPDSGAAVLKKTRKQVFNELAATVCESTGTQSYDVGQRIICQVLSAQSVGTSTTDLQESMIGAISSIKEIAPKNSVEAMLAAQMIATHEAALKFLRQSTLDEQSTVAIDANVVRATRLMRLHIQQIEAMQKLKGKAALQNLAVGQVNVHQGGQAIVGSVSTSKEGQ
jgi:hypothetical protein